MFEDYEFLEETDEQFEARMIEVKKKWAQLEKKFAIDKIRRDQIIAESNHILREIDELLRYIEYNSETDSEFESRLSEFKRKLS